MDNPTRTTYPRQRHGWVSTKVNPSGAQARLRSGRRERTKWFSYRQYGGRAQALQAASAWLELERRKMPASAHGAGLRTKVSPRKRDQSLPVGITESAYTLRNGNTGSRFQVLWHDGTYPRMKSFTIGLDSVATEADRRQALRKATAFRKAYEDARNAGKAFRPGKSNAKGQADAS